MPRRHHAVFCGRDKQADTKLTFTGLLNVLDGISASEGRLVFMTTNHRDALDQALIRPGRADVHVYIGNATVEQARQLFLRFFSGRVVEAQAFTELLGSERYSMAALNGATNV